MKNPPATDSEVAAIRAIARLDRLVAHNLGELSVAHYRILSAIAGGDERASRLAVRFALGKPAVSSAVDSLTRSGLVAKLTVADDQRATTLSLTKKGRAVLAAAEADVAAALGEVLAYAADSDGLIEALSLLGAAIEAEAQSRGAQATENSASSALEAAE